MINNTKNTYENNSNLSTTTKFNKRFQLKEITSHFKELLFYSSQENNKLLFLCLLTKKEIKMPVRGIECLHLECYDQESLCNELNKIESIQCLKCDKVLHYNNLILDNFLFTIMKIKGWDQKPITINKFTGKWSFTENNIENIFSDKISLNEHFKFPEIVIFPKLNEPEFKLQAFINENKSIINDIIVKQQNDASYFKLPNILINFSSDKTYVEEITERNRENNKFTIYCDIYDDLLKLMSNSTDKTKNLFDFRELLVYLHYLCSITSNIDIFINRDFIEKINKIIFNDDLPDPCNELIIFYFFECFLKRHNENSHIKQKEQIIDNLNNNKFIIINSSSQKNVMNNSIYYDNSIYNWIKATLIGSANSIYEDYEINPKKLNIFDYLQITESNEQNNSQFYLIENKPDKSIVNSVNNFVSLSSILSPDLKFLILSEDNLYYSNFTHIKDSSYCSCDITTNDLAYLLIPNIHSMDLLNQFLKFLSIKNFFVTNSKEYSSQFSIRILNKTTFTEFFELNVKSTNKIFVIFLRDVKKSELLEKMKFYSKTKLVKNLLDDEQEMDFQIQYTDDEFVKYYFFIEEENKLKFSITEQIEYIMDELSKIKLNTFNTISIRNKLSLITKRNTHEIRKIKD